MLRFDSSGRTALLFGLTPGSLSSGAFALADKQPQVAPGSASSVAVLVYHRFADVVSDSMTVCVSTFEAHLDFLRANGYEIVPLRRVVDWAMDRSRPMPLKAVALTVDDGHRSLYDRLVPIVERERCPITLFVYPGAVSNVGHALTWEQLRSLRRTGLFDVQAHAWWHPNFNVERRRQSPTAFHAFVLQQLARSRERLELEVGGHIDMIAWPFGLYNDGLLTAAAAAGHIAGFTLDARQLSPKERLLALPRFLMVDTCTPAILGRLLGDPPARLAGVTRKT